MIGAGTVVDVAYVSTFGRHLSQQIDQNEVPYLAHFQPQNIDNTVAATTVLGNIKQGVPHLQACILYDSRHDSTFQHR